MELRASRAPRPANGVTEAAFSCGLRQLALAMVVQAIRDTGSARHRREAAAWLTSPVSRPWLSRAGFSPRRVAWLASQERFLEEARNRLRPGVSHFPGL